MLEQFFNPSIKCDVPKKLFTACVGVVLISVVEVGFILSGSIGTGIILKRRNDSSSSSSGTTDNNEWSYPVACGLGGLGWGFLAGGSVKDIIVFIFDEDTLRTMAYDKLGVKVGGQLEATFGTTGRSANLDFTVSEKGFGNTMSYAFSKGVFIGMSVEGAVIGARHKINQKFYNSETITPDEIFAGGFEVKAMSDTKLQNVYTKLALITAGATAVPPALNSTVQEAEEPDIDLCDVPPKVK